MKLQEIVEYLELVAPLSIQEGYDNCGLIFGDKELALTSSLITLDCTEAVVDEAINKGANLIVAHHPIVFTGLKRFSENNYIQRTLIKAIQNNIAIYAIHTNLDKVKKGVNHQIGQKLQLKNLQFLSSESFEVGHGMIGDLEKPLSEVEFLQYIKNEFKVPFLKHTELLQKDVKKVAFCGGSGSFLLNEALAQNADVFLSSDFKYHQYFDAENKILVVDIGHYEAEICTKELIYEILTKKFPTFTLHFSEVNTNPVKYL